MATNIDRAMVPADRPVVSEPVMEIEIENPDRVTVGVDGLEVVLEPEEEAAEEFEANLAEFMDEGALSSLASELVELVDADINSRKDWTEMYIKGLEVLGMKYEERTEPWSGACGVFSPLLTEAAVRFQSEMIVETFPAQGPVKTQIIGEITRVKEEVADRVREDMNVTLTEKMVDYRSEHERMLYSLGLSGAAFKKIYPDDNTALPAAPFVPAEDLIIPYGASNVYTAERVTHVMRKTKNEIRKLQVSGFYRDVELGEPAQFFTDIEKIEGFGEAAATQAAAAEAPLAHGMENFPIEELELGVRSYNCLKRVGIETIGDLVSKTEGELAAIPNFGRKSIEEVKETLATHGLNLRGEE